MFILNLHLSLIHNLDVVHEIKTKLENQPLCSIFSYGSHGFKSVAKSDKTF